MATIRSRGNKQWQVMVRRRGWPDQSRTFETKADAETWARLVESEMDRGVFQSTRESERTTVGAALDRYAAEILPSKKSQKPELSRMAHLKSRLGSYSLASVTSTVLAGYRDQRLKETGPQSVIHELSLLGRVYRAAVMEWGISLPAGIPTALVRKPKKPSGRDRRLEDGEAGAILAHLRPPMDAIFCFATFTAMRRGEIAAMVWKNVDLRGRVLLVPEGDAKNGEARQVPLSAEAVWILQNVTRRIDGKVWGVQPDSITQAVARARKKAGITGLRTHDMRHEATSRLFEMGFGQVEAAAVTGHKDLRMLQRYTHLKGGDLAEKMDAARKHGKPK